MGLSKTQMNDLVDKIQHILDNPVTQINYEKISQQFTRLLEQGIEYDEEEIQYVLRKLKLPNMTDVGLLSAIADEPLSQHKFAKNLKSSMTIFEKDNKELVDFLKLLRFPTVNNRSLSYETDHWFLMNEFEKFLKKGIVYHMDDIRNWLSFSKSDNLLEDNVIEEIARISEFTQMNFKRPKQNT